MYKHLLFLFAFLLINFKVYANSNYFLNTKYKVLKSNEAFHIDLDFNPYFVGSSNKKVKFYSSDCSLFVYGRNDNLNNYTWISTSDLWINQPHLQKRYKLRFAGCNSFTSIIYAQIQDEQNGLIEKTDSLIFWVQGNFIENYIKKIKLSLTADNN